MDEWTMDFIKELDAIGVEKKRLRKLFPDNAKYLEMMSLEVDREWSVAECQRVISIIHSTFRTTSDYGFNTREKRIRVIAIAYRAIMQKVIHRLSE